MQVERSSNNMKRLLPALFVVLFISGTISAADRQLLGMMMPDAKVLGGMNVIQVRTSPYGQYLLSQGPFNDPQFQQFVMKTGFDPLRDITEVVVASRGVPGDKSGLVAARGTFNIQQIIAFVQTNGGTVDQSHGVPLITGPHGEMAIALIDNTLALAGDADSVIAAIPRRTAPSTLDPVLVAKADALSASADAWAATTVSPGAAGLPTGSKPGGFDLTALQSIQQSSAGVKFGASVNVNAEVVTDTPQNASALADVARLLVKLGEMNPQSAQIAPLLESVSIQTAGTAVQLSVSIPENLIEQMGPAGKRRAIQKVAVPR
jgi:hypothetical protein